MKKINQSRLKKLLERMDYQSIMLKLVINDIKRTKIVTKKLLEQQKTLG